MQISQRIHTSSSILSLIAFFIVSPTSHVLTASEISRQRTCFDFDWRFHLGNIEGAEAKEFDDSGWRQLNVPHDWSVEHPFSDKFASGTGYLPGGIGWYRKSFEVPKDWEGREVRIEFDGIQRNSDVWINGHHLGHRPYGYAAFEYRLTPHLQYGKKNVIVVRAERENVADSRWYTGSGIYRHVWLKVTNPVHVGQWGIFVTTPRVTKERADIMVSSTVVSEAKESTSVRVVSEIVDPTDNALSEQSTNVELSSGQEKTIAHWHVHKNPQLWSTESPILYTNVTRIYRDKELIDEVRTPFGIRTYYFDADEGFFLNGKSMKIKGLCTHHDAGVVGAAVPNGMLERRLRLVKELGANAVRCSHNPMASEYYSICDRLGLLVMDEAFDEWELGKRKWVQGRNVGESKRFGYNEHFEEWGVRDCEDMVRRSRNHPSIILWSIGNEIDYPGDPYAHPEYFDPAAPPIDEGSPSATRLAVIAPQLISAVKKYDPTRPVTMALSNMPAANGVGLANMLDVAGYNYQEQFYEQDHLDFPGRVIYGSENGRGFRSWQAVARNDFISSIYLWVGFDFLGEAGRWPNHGSRSGVFDSRGFLKPQSWMQKVLWDERPVVRLFISRNPSNGGVRRQRIPFARHPRTWIGNEGESVPVIIFSNRDSLQLKLNGKVIELTKTAEKYFQHANVPFSQGSLTVEAFETGKVVASDVLESSGKAAKLELVSDHQELRANGQDVSHIEVRIVDVKGRLVSNSNAEVSIKAIGAGRLLGVDNGNQNDSTPLNSSIKRCIDGRLLAIIQSTRSGGSIEVTAESPELQPATLRLSSK